MSNSIPLRTAAVGTGCRSHESNLRRDGSEPVLYQLKIDDIEFFGVSVNLKYHF